MKSKETKLIHDYQQRRNSLKKSFGRLNWEKFAYASWSVLNNPEGRFHSDNTVFVLLGLGDKVELPKNEGGTQVLGYVTISPKDSKYSWDDVVEKIALVSQVTKMELFTSFTLSSRSRPYTTVFIKGVDKPGPISLYPNGDKVILYIIGVPNKSVQNKITQVELVSQRESLIKKLSLYGITFSV